MLPLSDTIRVRVGEKEVDYPISSIRRPRRRFSPFAISDDTIDLLERRDAARLRGRQAMQDEIEQASIRASEGALIRMLPTDALQVITGSRLVDPQAAARRRDAIMQAALETRQRRGEVEALASALEANRLGQVAEMQADLDFKNQEAANTVQRENQDIDYANELADLRARQQAIEMTLKLEDRDFDKYIKKRDSDSERLRSQAAMRAAENRGSTSTFKGTPQINSLNEGLRQIGVIADGVGKGVLGTNITFLGTLLKPGEMDPDDFEDLLSGRVDYMQSLRLSALREMGEIEGKFGPTVARAVAQQTGLEQALRAMDVLSIHPTMDGWKRAQELLQGTPIAQAPQSTRSQGASGPTQSPSSIVTSDDVYPGRNEAEIDRRARDGQAASGSGSQRFLSDRDVKALVPQGRSSTGTQATNVGPTNTETPAPSSRDIARYKLNFRNAMNTFDSQEAGFWFDKYLATLGSAQQRQAERQFQAALDLMDEAKASRVIKSGYANDTNTWGKYQQLIGIALGF